MDLSICRKEHMEFLLEHALKISNSKIKETTFPIARIRKIMRLDPDINLIKWEVPILLSHLTEIFIKDLSFNAWNYTKTTGRKIIRKCDLCVAAYSDSEFDFLVNVLPYYDLISSNENNTEKLSSQQFKDFASNENPSTNFANPAYSRTLSYLNEDSNSIKFS
ncbi:hypothetical protein HZS_7876 [Henneguya salminicola]|nr:hypothetical protein HZS_7876 [Henneguya salminicola]